MNRVGGMSYASAGRGYEFGAGGDRGLRDMVGFTAHFFDERKSTTVGDPGSAGLQGYYKDSALSRWT